MVYAPIILLNNCNSTSFTPAALNTKPTAIKAITKNPISLENSRLNPRYTPITAIAMSTKLCALDKNQLYKFCPKFIIFCSFPSFQFLFLRLLQVRTGINQIRYASCCHSSVSVIISSVEVVCCSISFL